MPPRGLAFYDAGTDYPGFFIYIEHTKGRDTMNTYSHNQSRRMNTAYRWVVIAAVCALPLSAGAAELITGEQPGISSDQRMAEDTYIFGGSVSSAGTITGDLVAGGGQVTISGPVSQDLIVGGGSINILSTVGDDLRVGGGNVVVAGKVTGDVIAGGGQVTITGPGVGGDIIAGAGTLRIEAPVSGDVRIGGGSVFINAPIGGAVYFKGDKLELGANAKIGKDLTYSSPKEVTMADGATVAGTVNYTESTGKDVRAGRTAVIAAVLSLALLAKLLMTFVCALIFGLLLKRYTRTLLERISDRPLLELRRGFATLVLLPVASILLLVTVVGIPFGALGLIGFAALMIFASIAAPIVLGSFVHSWFSKSKELRVTWLTILTGSVLYIVLTFIPVVGWIAKALLVFLVVGAASKIKWDIVKEWR